MNLDFYIFHLLNQFAGRYALLDKLAIFFADYLQYIIAIILLAFILKNFKKNLEMLVSVISAVFLSRIVIVETLRHFFSRLRPFVEYQVNLLLKNQPAGEPSFPSGHASFFFALATAVYFYNKKLGIFLFISAFLISISRVFGGIHWPSDIIAGALIGIFSGWLVNKLFKRSFQAKTPQ